jgi:uncharacterized protein YijF (DUF1287 family)
VLTGLLVIVRGIESRPGATVSTSGPPVPHVDNDRTASVHLGEPALDRAPAFVRPPVPHVDNDRTASMYLGEPALDRAPAFVRPPVPHVDNDRTASMYLGEPALDRAPAFVRPLVPHMDNDRTASMHLGEPALDRAPPNEAHALLPAAVARCEPEALPRSSPVPTQSELALLDDRAFGHRLARAASAQVGGLTYYDARYRRIAFPMGDVPALYGVCTDVIIRAYRALGIDLQVLVHRSGVGSGDRSIDHRRTETLRRFLARHARSLPVSDVADDYRPGDIVTYHRPQNRSSASHIAIVSDRRAPSGRRMIVHNRGWGVQLEDALFVDRITGHYRYRVNPDEAPSATTLARATVPR